jgi:hypothetical protein
MILVDLGYLDIAKVIPEIKSKVLLKKYETHWNNISKRFKNI